MTRLEQGLLALAALGVAAAAMAAETITYTYDARGRLIKVVHIGTVNNGVNTTGESLHPDFHHPGPIRPHWDYRAPDGSQYRWFGPGDLQPKAFVWGIA